MQVLTLKRGVRSRVPVAELSALAVRRGPSAVELFAVGDEDTNLLVADVGPRAEPGAELVWRSVSTNYRPPKGGSNFEGVAVDGGGVVIVLTERPAGLLVVDGQRHIVMDQESLRGLAPDDFANRSADDGLEVEGIVLMRDGHVLVAHEKNPTGLVEFGPPGDPPLAISPDSFLADDESFEVPEVLVLAALAWWPIDPAIRDVSDIALRGRRLYVLSDQSRTVVRVAQGHQVPGAAIDFDVGWRLPGRMRNPEGLAFIGDAMYVGFDRPARRKNIERFPSLPE